MRAGIIAIVIAAGFVITAKLLAQEVVSVHTEGLLAVINGITDNAFAELLVIIIAGVWSWDKLRNRNNRNGTRWVTKADFDKMMENNNKDHAAIGERIGKLEDKLEAKIDEAAKDIHYIRGAVDKK